MNLISQIYDYFLGYRENNDRRNRRNSLDIRNWFPTRRISSVGEDLSEITYFTCLRILCETVAKVPIEYIDDSYKPVNNQRYYKLFNISANNAMTPYTWLQVMIFHMYHYGNAYSYIKTNEYGFPIGFIPLDPRNMKVLVDNMNLFEDRSVIYNYIDSKNGDNIYFLDDEILHFKGGISDDGLVGQCIRLTLASTFQGSKMAQELLNDLYASGLTPAAVLEYTGDLSTQRRKSLTESIKDIMNDVNKSSRVIPIPLGMSLKALNMKLTDAEYTELREFTVEQISAAFGVPLSMINNYKTTSSGQTESSQIQFYNSTIQPIFTKIEQEMDKKLLTSSEVRRGRSFKFRVGDMIKGDRKTQVEVIRSLIAGGVYSINEARHELQMPPIEGGDMHIINGAGTSIEDGKLVKDLSTTPESSEINQNLSTSTGGEQENGE